MSTRFKHRGARLLLPAALVLGFGGAAAAPSAVAQSAMPQAIPLFTFVGTLDNFCTFTFTNGQTTEEFTYQLPGATNGNNYLVLEKQPDGSFAPNSYSESLVKSATGCQPTPF